jgi:hypothetical protein
MQKKLMDDVSEARPLARLQEQLEEATIPVEVEESAAKAENGNAQGKKEDQSKTTTPETLVSRKPLLNNVDNELDRLSRVSLNSLKLSTG